MLKVYFAPAPPRPPSLFRHCLSAISIIRGVLGELAYFCFCEFWHSTVLCLPARQGCLPLAYPVLTPRRQPAYPDMTTDIHNAKLSCLRELFDGLISPSINLLNGRGQPCAARPLLVKVAPLQVLFSGVFPCNASMSWWPSVRRESARREVVRRASMGRVGEA